jgi:hypothetical protein
MASILLKNNREVMVSTFAVKRSENLCHRHRLPFLFYAKPNIMNDFDPHPTVSGSEGSIHINLDQEIVSGYKQGIKVFEGTYYGQV